MNNQYEMSIEDNVIFAKRNLVDSIYKEAKLEGIGVTFPQTNEIYEGRSVAGLSIDDIVKINNLKHAWQFVFDTIDYPVDLRYIRQMNYEVGQRIVNNAGELRATDVSIGGTSWKPELPDIDKENGKISAIINSDVSDTEKAVDMMLYIMRAQMFYDGNKRTAQLVANQMLISKGRGILSIPDNSIGEFLGLLIPYYETNNPDEIKYFIDKKCIMGIKEKTKESISTEAINSDNRQSFYLKKNIQDTLMQAVKRRIERRKGWGDRGEEWQACDQDLKQIVEALAGQPKSRRESAVREFLAQEGNVKKVTALFQKQKEQMDRGR